MGTVNVTALTVTDIKCLGIASRTMYQSELPLFHTREWKVFCFRRRNQSVLRSCAAVVQYRGSTPPKPIWVAAGMRACLPTSPPICLAINYGRKVAAKIDPLRSKAAIGWLEELVEDDSCVNVGLLTKRCFALEPPALELEPSALFLSPSGKGDGAAAVRGHDSGERAQQGG